MTRVHQLHLRHHAPETGIEIHTALANTRRDLDRKAMRRGGTGDENRPGFRQVGHIKHEHADCRSLAVAALT